MKKEIEAMQGQVDETWKAIYEEIGVDADAVDAYRQSLKDLDAQVAGLLALSPEGFSRNAKRLKMQRPNCSAETESHLCADRDAKSGCRD